MKKKERFALRAKKDWKKNKTLYFMIIPVLIFYLVFMYKPMYGAIIAFMDYRPGDPGKRLGGRGAVCPIFSQSIFLSFDS